MSIWLARLRRELGDPLFVRTPRGMLPTPRIDAMIATVRALAPNVQLEAAAIDARERTSSATPSRAS